jgi:hypothetical protein
MVELSERRLYLDQLGIEGLDIGEGFDTLDSWADPCALELTRSDSYGFVCDFPQLRGCGALADCCRPEDDRG